MGRVRGGVKPAILEIHPRHAISIIRGLSHRPLHGSGGAFLLDKHLYVMQIVGETR